MKFTFLLLILLINENYGARILGLFPFHGTSHWAMFEALMKGLAEKGHTVDVVSHFPQRKPIPRYNDISIEGSMPSIKNSLTVDVMSEWTPIVCIDFIALLGGNGICEMVLNQTKIQDLYKSKHKYDVIITEIFGTDCMLAFAHSFKVPTVAIVSSVALPWIPDRFGLPDNPSYIPNYLLPFTENMSLYERFINTMLNVYSKFRFNYLTLSESNKIVREKLDPNLPSLSNFIKNTSLLIVNSHFSINGARPMPPNVVEVAGLHVGKPTGKLPTNLEKVLNESKNGVIYFCLGSMIRTESFTIEKQRALLDAFGELPFTVIWKGEEDKFPAPIPKNIYFDTWLPQLEILCHPKTKVFITHGGLMGTQEAIACGTPLIGLPFFGDQDLNIGKYVEKGIAEKLSYETLTKTNILNALNKVLYDPKYERNMKYLSELYKDRPMSAMETAVYWIEYVIRHKGAPHLRPYSVNLTWYQYYMYDVMFISIILVLIVLSVTYFLIKLIIKQFIGSKNPHKQKTN
ncbi:UDP-glycosyltransferase UGT5-like [Chrysoperla carnea]|uniref:UDP-glycosyltransferase UGT5-like n=1 Tax=Chrysoperla carnea TaxID=189513 RepID=UPI001D064BDF|nr:UDP-glycosyltransferase UGT5-like [Chrysoperla carnea]